MFFYAKKGNICGKICEEWRQSSEWRKGMFFDVNNLWRKNVFLLKKVWRKTFFGIKKFGVKNGSYK